jgi:hypothetical protein
MIMRKVWVRTATGGLLVALVAGEQIEGVEADTTAKAAVQPFKHHHNETEPAPIRANIVDRNLTAVTSSVTSAIGSHPTRLY